METIKETTKETFWQFLAENKIEIPMIQRDYAQGRRGKEKLRETFLCELKAALDEGGKTVTLDFVYGTKSNGVVTPLDGQQRLTTLWLLHWYVAYRAKMLRPVEGDPCSASRVVSRLKRFTYATRMSSRLFCEKLSEFSDLPTGGKSIRKHLENQTWFRKQWRHDPTIQAMLGMISGYGEDSSSQNEKGRPDKGSCLEEVFASCDEETYARYWEKLSGAECPITFYCLDLPGLRRSDDLYIKMNARGKPLTSFENFKADLVAHIKDLVAHIKKIDPSHQDLADQKDGFSIKLDTVWADKVFWPLRLHDGAYDGIWDGRIDDIVFAFFNRYCANMCAVLTNGKDKYAERLKAFCGDGLGPDGKKDDDTRIAYTGFEDYREVLTPECLGELCRIFDAFDASLGFYSRYGFDFHAMPRYADDNAEKVVDAAGVEIPKFVPITSRGRVLFHAFCRFFANEKMPMDPDQRKSAFEDWMRVTWNIVENYGVGNDNTMIGCLKLVHELSAHSHDILSFLKSDPHLTCGSKRDAAQVAEEIAKAKQILNPDGSRRIYDGSMQEFQGKSWRDVIDRAEKFAFFNGAIRFLFHNSEGKVEWSTFDEKWQNAEKYFDGDGVREEYRKSALLLRAFLARQILAKKKDGSSDWGSKTDEWFGNGRGFWRESVLLNADCACAVSELLSIPDLSESCALPQDSGVPDWIRDEGLLSDAINSDSRNLEWHIIRGWRGCGRTLTRYSRRETRHVNYPHQIIPLDLPRNDLMAGFESAQRRGSKWFIGWNTNIDFVYRNFKFRWCYEGDKTFVYFKKDGAKDEKLRFEVVMTTQEDFKRRLDELIDSSNA